MSKVSIELNNLEEIEAVLNLLKSMRSKKSSVEATKSYDELFWRSAKKALKVSPITNFSCLKSKKELEMEAKAKELNDYLIMVAKMMENGY